MKKGFSSTLYLCLTILVVIAFLGIVLILPVAKAGSKELASIGVLFLLAVILAIITRMKMRREENGMVLST